MHLQFRCVLQNFLGEDTFAASWAKRLCNCSQVGGNQITSVPVAAGRTVTAMLQVKKTLALLS